MSSIINRFLEAEQENVEGGAEGEAEKSVKDMELTPEQRELVEKNLGLAGFYANKFKHSIPEADYSDIFQTASLGLSKAAKAWSRKPEKERETFPFNRYAARAILNHLKYQYHIQKTYADAELKTLDAPAAFDVNSSAGATNKDYVVGGDTTFYKAPSAAEILSAEDEDAENPVDKDADDETVDLGDVEDEELRSSPRQTRHGDYAASRSGGSDLAKKEAYKLVVKALNSLPAEEKIVLTKWMKGESYREMQTDPEVQDVLGNVSFVQIGNIARRGTAAIKAELERVGIKGLSDVLPESLNDGKVARKQLVEAIMKSKPELKNKSKAAALLLAMPILGEA